MRRRALRNAMMQSLFGDAPPRPVAAPAPRATQMSLFGAAELDRRPPPPAAPVAVIPAAELPKLAREYERITHLQSTGTARTEAMDKGSKFRLYDDFVASIKRRYGPRAEQQLIAYLDSQVFALRNGRKKARRNPPIRGKRDVANRREFDHADYDPEPGEVVKLYHRRAGTVPALVERVSDRAVLLSVRAQVHGRVQRVSAWVPKSRLEFTGWVRGLGGVMAGLDWIGEPLGEDHLRLLQTILAGYTENMQATLQAPRSKNLASEPDDAPYIRAGRR